MNPTNSSVGKSLPIPSTHLPAVQAGPPAPNFESSRRASQAGATAPQPVPRKGQGARKQHRNMRQPNLGDRGSDSLVDEDDAMAELRALRNPSSRRGQTSITHLLNYSAPLQYQDHSPQNTRSYRRPTWGPGSGYHAADKARYVHANYRFIVSPEGSYSKQAADPDLFVDWSNVMQVLASPESQAASCPICLDEPVAPRMAKCGHILCLPCLIRYMNSHADEEAKPNRGIKWKKCPICEDSIYMNDVKPVRFYVGQESPLPRVGDDVVLRLMARNATSTLALPKEGGAEVLNSGDDVPWHFAANVLDYARIMKGSRDYMIGQFDEEIETMLQQAKEDELMYGQAGESTQKAINAVAASKEKLDGLRAVEDVARILDLNTTKQSSATDFYFYSALPHLYLSPLDIRILKTKFGSFSSFPSTLLPRVEHISTGHAVDDVQRKRAKYLGHLPYGCVISFLECDWTDIIPAETLETFASDIEKRRSRNREKAAQEERERVQSERLEAANLRKLTGSRRAPSPIHEDSVPRMDMSEFQPLASASGATPPDPRPGFSTLASMSTSPSNQRTVWGTPALPVSPTIEPTIQPNSDDGWLKDDNLLSLGPAELAMQLEALTTMEKGEDGPSGSAGNRGGGKKKKKQKITLMSTGGRRGL
ncbi:putative RING finger protein P8B7.23 [Cladobotryum mycophilum]|uniref:RING finger protein P8B7.23 n=1 Tax=Cladobotryum mycophilum TaxID=491253 RepID=A0ABR0S5H3_9HYPO